MSWPRSLSCPYAQLPALRATPRAFGRTPTPVRRVEETSAGGFVLDHRGRQPQAALIARRDRRGSARLVAAQGPHRGGRDRRRTPRSARSSRRPASGAASSRASAPSTSGSWPRDRASTRPSTTTCSTRADLVLSDADAEVAEVAWVPLDEVAEPAGATPTSAGSSGPRPCGPGGPRATRTGAASVRRSPGRPDHPCAGLPLHAGRAGGRGPARVRRTARPAAAGPGRPGRSPRHPSGRWPPTTLTRRCASSSTDRAPGERPGRRRHPAHHRTDHQHRAGAARPRSAFQLRRVVRHRWPAVATSWPVSAAAWTRRRPRVTPLPGTLAPGASMPVTLTMPLRGEPADGLALDRPGVYELLVNVNGVPRDGLRAGRPPRACCCRCCHCRQARVRATPRSCPRCRVVPPA